MASVVWDEMKVKEGLVFDKHTCNVIRFTSIGQINDGLDKVQWECEIKNPPSNVATHFHGSGIMYILGIPVRTLRKYRCYSL